MTKEELLSKGISEKDADEIIASFYKKTETSDDPLLLLEKALNGTTEEQELSKARKQGKEDEDDEDEDDEGEEEYDEEYMKKYMKRFMKENKKSASKAAKEAGIFNEEMKKAVEEIDSDVEGAVIEMFELSPILEKQMKFNESMSKAVQEISEKINIISSQHEKSYDIMEKAARLQVEQAKFIDKFLSIPQGRKGVTANIDMMKATEIITPEQTKLIYQVLMKATMNKDAEAGKIISKFESSGKRLQALSQTDKQYIQKLIAN